MDWIRGLALKKVTNKLGFKKHQSTVLNILISFLVNSFTFDFDV